MNKLGLRPPTILKRTLPIDSRRIRNSAKVLGVILGALFALSGTIAICLFVFGAIKARTSASKGSAEVPVHPVAEAPPSASATPANKYNGVVIEQPANQASRETALADHSAIVQTSTPALAATPASVPVLPSEQKTPVKDSEFLESKLPNAEPKSPDTQLSKSARKNLEKERREAERKRSRLEQMYQKHEISSDAYKKGEAEYKSAIEKYRSAVNSSR
jgi:hypothetical protein